MKRFFLITVDTEGDNLWEGPKEITTRNASFLPRFQELCESFGFKPTYLVDYEMARSPVFRDFGREILKKGKGEIGMHLHAWNTPPLVPLTDDDHRCQPYLFEYPETAIREKTDFLTNLLEEIFEEKIISHRAGRWGFNSTYAKILAEKGYRVDCSVTPHVSWKNYQGDPDQSGGPDFRLFPEEPYYLNLDDIGRPGDSNLLEIPVTIYTPPVWQERIFSHFRPRSVPWRVLNRIFTHERWLRPNGKNLGRMIGILREAVKDARDCAVFMIHSSELMPGGSPVFPGEKEIEKLYRDLERLFQGARQNFQGATLREYCNLIGVIRNKT